MTPEEIQNQIGRYFVAVHGKDFVYRAPETYPSRFDRWLHAIMVGDEEMAEKQLKEIETFWEERRSYPNYDESL